MINIEYVLNDRMRKQAERWGAQLRTEDVEFVDVEGIYIMWSTY